MNANFLRPGDCGAFEKRLPVFAQGVTEFQMIGSKYQPHFANKMLVLRAFHYEAIALMLCFFIPDGFNTTIYSRW